MSVDYYFVCHKHKEKVRGFSDGMSGPMNQCDRSLAYFGVTHRKCDISIVDENNDEDIEGYAEWDKNNKEQMLSYEAEG